MGESAMRVGGGRGTEGGGGGGEGWHGEQRRLHYLP